MNSFELNKIAMALLLTVLLLMGVNGLSDAVFEDSYSPNAFPVEMEEEEVAPVEVVVVEEGPLLADLLAVASVEKGATVFKKCKVCHTSDNGGKNMIGPNLWNVVGRAKGGADGFSYSSAMKESGGDWSYEDLDAFLKKPSDFMAKTKMKFAGLKKSNDRAAVITLLRSFSDAPVDLPAVAAPEAEAEVEEEAEAEVAEEVSAE